MKLYYQFQNIKEGKNNVKNQLNINLLKRKLKKIKWVIL